MTPVDDPLRATLERRTQGRYAVERELGRGGMGTVYLARDLSLDRHVAIKVLPTELAIQAALRERFVREAKLAASLSHPNIVQVYAVEEHDDLLAFVMQYVDGENLAERVARAGPFDATTLARFLQDTAWALGYAHARGIVHRDVKPDNILVERGTGRAMIMDFGIARQQQASNLTEVGHSIGTPRYMSPEQAAAEPVDGRSDLYSLGCVGYFAATGRPPFDAESAHKLLMQHLTVAAPRVREHRSELPAGLDDAIARALAKDPAERFATGEAMADAIGALQLRAAEVAPILRLFHQQTAHSLQALLTLSLVFFVFYRFSGMGGSFDGLIAAVLFLTVGTTVVLQAIDRVRYVVRAGFANADVNAAFATIAEEIRIGREQLLEDPVERTRAARRRRIAMGFGFIGGMSIPPIIRFAVSGDPGKKAITPPGAVALLAVTAMVGIAIALWTMRPVRVTLAQKVAHRIWAGRFGRWVFARAERRYAAALARARSAA
ncbi:MAG: serine/threonine protein kinase [Gemmatimonadaceae bacterium]|nr:serine/threonine protein kinase [Gemmatimonadaceae bacterium]